MVFDFSKLARGGAISSITDPAVLFDALPNKADGYGYLRAVQKTVLDAWSARRDDRDLVLKTNTGGGKTIAGLLILQCCLHDGVAPVLYVVPDPHLQEHVMAEAANLGLAVVDDPDSGKFLGGKAICVTTMPVLVNGRTRFGLVGSGSRQPVRVGAVVMDDAHAALVQMEEKTRLRVPRGHEAYDKLLDLFDAELRDQGLNALLDIRDGDRSAVLRIPFWSWRDKQEQVLQVLRPHRSEEILEWSWPLVSDLLHLCQAVVTADAVEVMPPCPPIEKIPSFGEADRRIYLTATLADDSVLVTHFDADAVSIATSVVPDSAADLGDRLVLAPQELSPAITHDHIRESARILADTYNVVVLVPSHKQAGIWSGEADETVSTAADISAVVERLRADHVGLVVIVNRYDGIDLPDEACRVLVIDGLPQAYSGIERREAVALRDSEAMVTRQLQRLEQGMGRGVRSRDDRCAVVLVGSRLTQLVARVDVAKRLSPATRAQLELSRRIAEELEGSDMLRLQQVISQVIDGDADFRTASREALVGATYGPAFISPAAEPLRKAYNEAAAGRAEQARVHASEAVDAALQDGDERLAGWLGETLASYIQPLNPVEAQTALAAAAERNPAVLHPIAGLTYKRVKASGAQARQASENLQERYPTGAELRLGIEALLDDLTWDNERTDDTEAALAELADHLGIASQLPERMYGRGSDVLWALGDQCYAPIEAKSGAGSALIWKKDINQLAGSVNWCHDEYGPQAKVTPVMMHPSTTVAKSGTPPAGTRIITPEKLDDLKKRVRSYATALAQGEAYRDESQVADQLRQHKLTAGEIVAASTLAARRET